jgi:tripartite-type tricarboxylate transporter receptor subunit TctC
MKRLIACLAGCFLLCALAGAQGVYPARPITIIVPFAAGSGTDLAARTLTAAITQQWAGAVFVIDNRPGANGIIAASLAAKAPPDGYTFFLTTNTTHSVNPYLYKTLPYDPVADFVPVGLVGETAPVLLTAATSSATTVRDVVAQAQRAPGKLNFASTNTSSLAATQLFEQRAAVKVGLINYKAAPQALTDTYSGTIDYFFGDLASGGALVSAGKLKALAVLSEKRLPGYPQVPTMAESGYRGLEIAIWIGVFAPRGTPATLVDRMNQAMVAALKRDEVIQSLHSTAVQPTPSTPAAFSAYAAAQLQRWGKLAKDINLQPE